MNKLGSGGQVTVFKVKCIKDVTYAAKIYVCNTPNSENSCNNEVNALEILQGSKHIVTLKEILIFDPKTIIIIMEKGKKDLFQKIDEDSYNEELFKSYLIQIAEGIETIHSKGLIHNDIKPENLILSHDGTIKITDFGFTRRKRSSTYFSSENFSKYWIAPEKYLQKEIGEFTDVFAYGLIAFFIRTRSMLILKENDVNNTKMPNEIFEIID